MTIGNFLNGLADGYRADKAREQRSLELDALTKMAQQPPRQRYEGAQSSSGRTVMHGQHPVYSGGGGVDPSFDAARVAQELGEGIYGAAEELGIDPEDLATAFSYETAGTFNPTKRGPRTQHGQHIGLIQFGEEQARTHGVDWDNPVQSQLGPKGAVVSYLRNAGVKPGMGMMDIYSAINAGTVGRYGASDAHNGGDKGDVRYKVTHRMRGHREKARAVLAQYKPKTTKAKRQPTIDLNKSRSVRKAIGPIFKTGSAI